MAAALRFRFPKSGFKNFMLQCTTPVIHSFIHTGPPRSDRATQVFTPPSQAVGVSMKTCWKIRRPPSQHRTPGRPRRLDGLRFMTAAASSAERSASSSALDDAADAAITRTASRPKGKRQQRRYAKMPSTEEVEHVAESSDSAWEGQTGLLRMVLLAGTVVALLPLIGLCIAGPDTDPSLSGDHQAAAIRTAPPWPPEPPPAPRPPGRPSPSPPLTLKPPPSASPRSPPPSSPPPPFRPPPPATPPPFLPPSPVAPPPLAHPEPEGAWFNLRTPGCAAMLDDTSSKFHQLWGKDAWVLRRRSDPRAETCWSYDRNFFENALKPSQCDANWLEGAIDGGPEQRPGFDAARPADALLGFDGTSGITARRSGALAVGPAATGTAN